MYNKNSLPKISLIAFASGEKDELHALVEGIHKVLENYPYELIVLDRYEVILEVEKLVLHYPVKLISYKDKGDMASMLIAELELAGGKILGVMDANSGYSPGQIPELLKAIEGGADIAIASRYRSGGGIRNLFKKGETISRLNTMLTRLVLPSVRKMRDPMSGLFLFKRSVVEGVELKPGNTILLQILSKRQGGEVREEPCVEERVCVESKFNLREYLGYLKNIFFLAAKEKEIRRLVQFGLVGLSGVGVNMGLFWFLTRYAGLAKPYDYIALVLSMVAATFSNFILNDIWTFRDRRTGDTRNILVRALKFGLISIGYYVIYTAVYTSLNRFMGIYDLAAVLIAIGIGFIWNFTMNIFWTWRKR